MGTLASPGLAACAGTRGENLFLLLALSLLAFLPPLLLSREGRVLPGAVRVLPPGFAARVALWEFHAFGLWPPRGGGEGLGFPGALTSSGDDLEPPAPLVSALRSPPSRLGRGSPLEPPPPFTLLLGLSAPPFSPSPSSSRGRVFSPPPFSSRPAVADRPPPLSPPLPLPLPERGGLSHPPRGPRGEPAGGLPTPLLEGARGGKEGLGSRGVDYPPRRGTREEAAGKKEDRLFPENMANKRHPFPRKRKRRRT